MRMIALSSVLLAFAAVGCMARQATAPTRATPSGTVEMFKLHARYGNRAGEWDILSPAFKRRLSEQAGRTVDVADYVQARDMYRSDPRVQAAEQMLQTAIVTRTQSLGPDRVRATIVTSGGPFSQSGAITMVRLQTWEVFVAGAPQPYSGFVGDPAFQAAKQSDGSFVISAEGRVVQSIPADRVREYRVGSSWYVDDLGDLEKQFVP